MQYMSLTMTLLILSNTPFWLHVSSVTVLPTAATGLMSSSPRLASVAMFVPLLSAQLVTALASHPLLQVSIVIVHQIISFINSCDFPSVCPLLFKNM